MTSLSTSTSSDNWRAFQVIGSSYKIQSGIASKLQEPNGCPDGWFSGDSSVILGSGEINGQPSIQETVAIWEIPFEPFWIQNFMRGFLVFGCIRYFGGLHSSVYGSQIEILLNDRSIDKFGLMISPPNHSDYFHRIEVPKLPEVWPLLDCQTIYAWPIQKKNLSSELIQRVKVKIGKEVSWDIDYVAIVCKAEKLPHRVFISHIHNDKKVARMLTKELTDRGIGVWLDEAEIKIGDFLTKKILDGIDTVEYLIILVSNSSLKSEWVKKEIDFAMNHKIAGKSITVLPILLENCDLPSFLKDRRCSDLTKLDNLEKVTREIEERLLQQDN